jgi:hypothetical protein
MVTVHAGDKALMQETPTQRGRVNRYVLVTKVAKIKHQVQQSIIIYFLVYLESSQS